MNSSSNLEKENTQLPVQQEGNFLQESFALFIQLLLKKWWLFVIIGAAAGITGYFKAKSQKVEYESNLTFVIDEESSGGGISGAINLAAQLGLNIGGSSDIFSGDNILEIIKSRRLVEKVLLSIDTFENKPTSFIEFYIQNTGNQKNKNIHFANGQTRNTFSYAQDSLLYDTYLDFVTTKIEADRPDKRLNIFAIKVKSFNEQFSKIFTDKLIHAADSFYIEICSKKTKETLEILEQRVAQMKGNLSSSISNRAASEDANLNPVFAEAQVPVQKQQVNIQVYGVAYSEMFKNLELARFQYLKKIPLVQIIDAADYPMKKIKSSKLKTALLFAFGAVFMVAFFMWLIRIYKIYK